MVFVRKGTILAARREEKKNYLHHMKHKRLCVQDKLYVDERNDDICGGGGRKGVVDLGLGTAGAVT